MRERGKKLVRDMKRENEKKGGRYEKWKIIISNEKQNRIRLGRGEMKLSNSEA